MDRAPRATAFALVLVMLVAPAALGRPGPGDVANPWLGEVTWPPSTLVVSEVATGGASASDEFVELANAGPAPVDLAGLEIAYVTATGSSVTRKATWPASSLLEPGRHVLVANASGAYAAGADVTYTGGFAATGGTLVLRPVGGAPIDAVGWGDATNGFVEGVAAPAPPPGSSLERLPGGPAGNATDTNDNAADWFVQAAPSPQNLGAEPTALPTPTPGETPGATPPDVTPSPVATPTATPTAGPPATPQPTPTPTPTRLPVVLAIADARGLPDGSSATIAGTLTTPLGAVEAGRGAFVQDGTGGIALYLDAPATDALPAGTTIVASGTLDDRFAQRTLRLAVGALAVTGSADVPVAVASTTGGAREPVEGVRLLVAGMTVGSPASMADGRGLLVDDGSGPLRVVLGAGIGPATIPSGTSVVALGPLGQRDSTGTGLAGYRLHVTRAADFAIVPSEPPPSPTPQPTDAATVTPGPVPTATPEPTSSPVPTATPTSSPGTVLEVRGAPIGSLVFVAGVVTAEAGRLGSPALLAIGDPTGGLVVRLPSGFGPPPRGRWLEVTGVLAAPYGQLEIRPAAGGIVAGPDRGLPPPLVIAGASLGETVEASLVTLDATVAANPRTSKSGDLTIAATATDGSSVRIVADASSGLVAKAFEKGGVYRFTGIAGQRATGKGRADGYRVWLRDAADVTALPSATPRASRWASPSPSPSAAPIPIGRALLLRGDVSVEGTVTIPATLLDATGRRIVVEDATGAVEVLLPAGATAPGPGTRIAVAGEVARAYGAPRIRAAEVRTLGSAAPPRPIALRSAPGSAHEWRLVRISGTLAEVHKLGNRWRVELEVGGARVPISGLAGASIPAGALVEGRQATVTGIVRRAHPSATDRRFAIAPRSPADLAVGPAGRAARPPGAGTSAGGRGAVRPGSTADDPPDVDLAALAAHLGRRVRVGGLVVDLTSDGATLDDGTAVGRIVLVGEAAAYVPLLEPGDAINAIGLVAARGGELVVTVRDPSGLARVGDLPAAAGAERVSTVPASGPSTSPSAEPPRRATADPLGLGPPGAAGLASLVLVALASVGATLVRRRLVRRRLVAHIAERVAWIGRASPGSRPSSGEGASHPDPR